MAIEGSGEIWQWVAGISGATAAFLLKHLHGKVSEAVSKAELATALKAVSDHRLEDIARFETYRQERRQTEKGIFDMLRTQGETLARIDGRDSRNHRNRSDG